MRSNRRQRPFDQVGVVARGEANHINQLCERDDTPNYEIKLHQSTPVRHKIRQISLCSVGYVLTPIIAMLHLLKR